MFFHSAASSTACFLQVSWADESLAKTPEAHESMSPIPGGALWGNYCADCDHIQSENLEISLWNRALHHLQLIKADLRDSGCLAPGVLASFAW